MTPPNLIHDTDINQVVNELRAAGAEAIAVNTQRLVATSAVRTAGPTVLVNNRPEAAPFVIKAIGDPKTLAGALNIPGGIASQITAYDKAMLTVQQAAMLTLPAYTGGDTPRYARPVSATDAPAPPTSSSTQRQTMLASLQQQRDTLQVKRTQYGGAFSRYEQAFDAALHQALPQSSSQAFAKARNLEFGIGSDAADLAALNLQAKQHPEKMQDARFIAEQQQLLTRLAQSRTEEAKLFPANAQTRQELAKVHALALHHPAKPLRLQVIDLELAMLNARIQAAEAEGAD